MSVSFQRKVEVQVQALEILESDYGFTQDQIDNIPFQHGQSMADMIAEGYDANAIAMDLLNRSFD